MSHLRHNKHITHTHTQHTHTQHTYTHTHTQHTYTHTHTHNPYLKYASCRAICMKASGDNLQALIRLFPKVWKVKAFRSSFLMSLHRWAGQNECDFS